MDREKMREWCHLQDFLNTEDDDTAWLTAEGTDVEAATAALKAHVTARIHERLKAQAERERAMAARAATTIAARIEGMSLQAVMRKLHEIAAQSGTGQLAALYREQEGEELSEEDLRAMLHDVLVAQENDDASDPPGIESDSCD